MNFVEPIHDRKKIALIKNQLRSQSRYRDLLLFVVGINTALRISDLLGLRVEHFLDNRQRIRHRFWIKEQKRGKRQEMTSMIDRTEYEADQHLEKLWEHDEKNAFSGLVDKYNGERLTGLHKPFCKRVADEKTSLTDPDATPIGGQGGGSAVLGYWSHYVVDVGEALIILSALVPPPRSWTIHICWIWSIGCAPNGSWNQRSALVTRSMAQLQT